MDLFTFLPGNTNITNIQTNPGKKKMAYPVINIEAQFKLEIKFYVRKEISSSGKL